MPCQTVGALASAHCSSQCPGPRVPSVCATSVPVAPGSAARACTGTQLPWPLCGANRRSTCSAAQMLPRWSTMDTFHSTPQPEGSGRCVVNVATVGVPATLVTEIFTPTSNARGMPSGPLARTDAAVYVPDFSKQTCVEKVFPQAVAAVSTVKSPLSSCHTTPTSSGSDVQTSWSLSISWKSTWKFSPQVTRRSCAPKKIALEAGFSFKVAISSANFREPAACFSRRRDAATFLVSTSVRRAASTLFR
mmetsp:Transcript_25481/g.58764  ORF Transcript_25481/g.58764 Transcript_25481/m.58764 type:complete len:248 (-) Transcript_25481:391-1134(-)